MVIVTTHELEAIDTLVDAAYVLNRGKAEALLGGPGTLRDRYRRAIDSAQARALDSAQAVQE
jgi:hypothetical protein